MNIKEAINLINGTILSHNEKYDIEISGIYCCDLLSYAMSNIKQNELWITVQTNLNVLAIAELTEALGVIIPENINCDDEFLKVARQKEILVISSPLSCYEICKKI